MFHFESREPALTVSSRGFPIRRWIEWGVALGIVILLTLLIVPAIQRAREAARQSSSKCNLKQLGLALHNYQDTHSRLPPGATITPAGDAHHGWMTQLLPYLDSSPLYNAIDFAHPWNDPVNAHLLRADHHAFWAKSDARQWTTDGWALTHYMANPRLLYCNSSVSLSEVENQSSTWCVGEIREGFKPWAYPYNWRAFHGGKDFLTQGFGRGHHSGGHLLLLDGSVRWVDTREDAECFLEISGNDDALHWKRRGPNEAQISQPEIRFAATHIAPTLSPVVSVERKGM